MMNTKEASRSVAKVLCMSRVRTAMDAAPLPLTFIAAFIVFSTLGPHGGAIHQRLPKFWVF